MWFVINNPTKHEIWAVIHFLLATNISAVVIHHELCAGYGQNVTSEGRRMNEHSG
jgi:hypothetical protein